MNASLFAVLRKLPRWPLWAAAPVVFSAVMATAVDLHAAASPKARAAAPQGSALSTPADTDALQR